MDKWRPTSSDKLRTWLRENTTYKAFASACGVHQRTIERIIYRGAIPRPDLMMRIWQMTNGDIRPADFYTFPVKGAGK